MKYLLVVTLFVTIISINCNAKVTPPAAVLSTFKQKFPHATKVSWEKEHAHEYEANFIENGSELSANFNEEGKWLETETPVSFNSLPEKVRIAFGNEHTEGESKGIFKIESAAGTVVYEIEIKSGLKNVDCLYNEDGTKTR